jgi:hypothetical protein
MTAGKHNSLAALRKIWFRPHGSMESHWQREQRDMLQGLTLATKMQLGSLLCWQQNALWQDALDQAHTT